MNIYMMLLLVDDYAYNNSKTANYLMSLAPEFYVSKFGEKCLMKIPITSFTAQDAKAILEIYADYAYEFNYDIVGCESMEVVK